MNECCISDLKNKEVINICTGRRIGYVCDVFVDICNGRVISLVVPYCDGRFWGLLRTKELIIPWGDVETVGDDLIIVRIDKPIRCEVESEIKEERRKRFFF